MQITRQADYAVRAMVYLAQLGQHNRASTSQIAQEKKIPPSFLAKIVSQLSVAGLLQTSRALAVVFHWQKEPAILLDGWGHRWTHLLNECVGDKECSFDSDCPMKLIW
jgi:hypothetical protein